MMARSPLAPVFLSIANLATARRASGLTSKFIYTEQNGTFNCYLYTEQANGLTDSHDIVSSSLSNHVILPYPYGREPDTGRW